MQDAVVPLTVCNLLISFHEIVVNPVQIVAVPVTHHRVITLAERNMAPKRDEKADFSFLSLVAESVGVVPFSENVFVEVVVVDLMLKVYLIHSFKEKDAHLKNCQVTQPVKQDVDFQSRVMDYDVRVVIQQLSKHLSICIQWSNPNENITSSWRQSNFRQTKAMFLQFCIIMHF